MDENILADPQKYCRTCLRCENANLDRFQSIYDSDPTMMSYEIAYSDMLKTFTNREVSCYLKKKKKKKLTKLTMHRFADLKRRRNAEKSLHILHTTNSLHISL